MSIFFRMDIENHPDNRKRIRKKSNKINEINLHGFLVQKVEMSFPAGIQLTVNGEVFFSVVGVEVRGLGRYFALVPAPRKIQLNTSFTSYNCTGK